MDVIALYFVFLALVYIGGKVSKVAESIEALREAVIRGGPQ